MKLSFAPLEGITTYTYRNTHAQMFDGCDEYYAPFINPGDQYKSGRKGIKDILPEKQKTKLKVQVITNKAESFLKFAPKIKDMGYDEININLGCPASTVVKKGRGAGFLKMPDEIDKFFDGIFSNCDMKVSVKTRIGFEDASEMERLMEIYNKYPLSLLIIHPRTCRDFYSGVPNYEAFEKAYKVSANKVCFNGNIYTVSDYEKLTERFKNLDSVMIGRGAVRNPALFREIKGGKPLETPELVEFTKRLIHNYMEVLQSDTFTLHKLKEIWSYIMQMFPEEKKITKAIKKSKTTEDLMNAVYCLPELL